MFCPLHGIQCNHSKTIPLVVLVNNTAIRQFVCPECPVFTQPDQAQWQDMLSNVFSLLQFDKILSQGEMKEVKSKIKDKDDLNDYLNAMLGGKPKEMSCPPCPNCGTTLREIIKHGKFSCHECYQHFHTEAADLIQHVQGGATSHVGKKPKTKPDKPDEKKLLTDIEILKAQLAKAIKEERFEDAAIIRDQITALERLN